MENKNTLESEIKEYANNLPSWSKYLASKILMGQVITEECINKSYEYLLDELNIEEKLDKAPIEINYNLGGTKYYANDLILSKVSTIKGVNALADNQVIEFNPKLTIIYGANGSGKSGYVRLFKSVFYSKAPEIILPNINKTNNENEIDAKFDFTSADSSINLSYNEKNKAIFRQFAVFDGKGIFQQLSDKNQFEFRPSGLSFFAYFTESIKRVEEKIKTEIQNKNLNNEFQILFDGESEIKTFIINLSEKTSPTDLLKYIPYSNRDKLEKEKIQKEYDDLLLTSMNKDTQIKKMHNIKKLLNDNKKTIQILNSYFTSIKLKEIREAICDNLSKENTAKDQGSENFTSNEVSGIGTKEWKNFIIAADIFCKNQNNEKSPDNKDEYCIFCHQPLSIEAKTLIEKYWLFLKSAAEEEARKSNDSLNNIWKEYEKLNFDLFPEETILSEWFVENDVEKLSKLQESILRQKKLCKIILADIQNRSDAIREEVIITVTFHDEIEKLIDGSINKLKENKQSKELETLLASKTYLQHKEKYNLHLSKFEIYINQLIWLRKAEKANFGKRKITETEKTLSERYFNQKYVEAFKEECNTLNGLFDISIDHTGSAGKSFRQLKLKGKAPNSILSEGEQKVIAIADFIAEMRLSEINKGIILDDPVSSLDDNRKSEIAKRLVEESKKRQVIIFTHDLVFVSSLATHCSERGVEYYCHWIEKLMGVSGYIWLNNSPSYEKKYRNDEPAVKYYKDAKKDNCPPEQRESYVKAGFTALRTCYEVLVIYDLFKNVVQRFNERVSIDSLSSVCFDNRLIKELQDSYSHCCQYMEGHSHSDKFAYKKPEPDNLNEEIQRYNKIRSIIKKYKPSEIL